jgi:riboflavin kinase/FMN adenylyltransferase
VSEGARASGPPTGSDAVPRGFVVLRDPPRLPQALARPVVAIGNFDGVHRGHKALIARAQAMAARLGRPCAVLTFEPHPSDFFARDTVIFRLTPEREKALALSRLGLDGVVALSFDAGLACLPAQAFVDEVLIARLDAAGVVVGYDFHFGAKRAGTPAFLAAQGAEKGFAVEIVEKIHADEDGSIDAVSSTLIRAALEAGDVARAARLLGHPFTVAGVVEHGRKLGRTLGFPTANIRLDPSARLAHGVYAVRARWTGGEGNRRTADGVASYGRRPTFDDGPPLFETYLFDFDGDLYGAEIEIELIAFLRPERKFDGADALIAQMREDERQARAALAR